jgi:hypothetical protein
MKERWVRCDLRKCLFDLRFILMLQVLYNKQRCRSLEQLHTPANENDVSFICVPSLYLPSQRLPKRSSHPSIPDSFIILRNPPRPLLRCSRTLNYGAVMCFFPDLMNRHHNNLATRSKAGSHSGAIWRQYRRATAHLIRICAPPSLA